MSNRIFLYIFTFLLFAACSSDDDNFNIDDDQQQGEQGDGGNDDDVDDTDENDDDIPEESSNIDIDRNSLATNGCQNVIIVNNFAYAACGDGIEVVSLESLERNFIDLSADDITADAGLELLFTQSGNDLRMLDISNPIAPTEIERINTNFGIFSGISAANGILVVSAGTGGSDTQVYTYTSTSLNLVNNGIASVDAVTGNPDVHLAESANGAVAFYSQDIGAVENWGIQIVEFDEAGAVIAIPPVVVLTPRRFTGNFGIPFGPANLPVESEFLNNTLYVAHFAAPGIHTIDLLNGNTLGLIPLDYEPTNVSTDGSLLFVVGVTETRVDIIDPLDNSIVDQIEAELELAIGVAASNTHIAIADRSDGLIIITR